MLVAAVTMAIQAAAVGLPASQATAANAFAGPVSVSGGRSIFLQCSGSGQFTVVLEPGDGGHRQHMAKLFDQLSSRYRVCAYDRRNMGLSSKAPLPRKAADLSADLFDSLEARGEKGPFVLFGSSIGGLLVRLHAATHMVAGFVTSNQVGTSVEWRAATYRFMSGKERSRDRDWQAGANNEHIDVNDVSRVIEQAGPPAVPYVIMISTERCGAVGAEDVNLTGLLGRDDAELVLDLEKLAVIHGAHSHDEVESRIERIKALACRGVALARRHMNHTLH